MQWRSISKHNTCGTCCAWMKWNESPRLSCLGLVRLGWMCETDVAQVCDLLAGGKQRAACRDQAWSRVSSWHRSTCPLGLLYKSSLGWDVGILKPIQIPSEVKHDMIIEKVYIFNTGVYDVHSSVLLGLWSEYHQHELPIIRKTHDKAYFNSGLFLFLNVPPTDHL